MILFMEKVIIMSNFKHLTLENRIIIQSDLHDGLSFKKIASHVDHDCTTVSKEIRNHSTRVEDMWPHNRKHNRCAHYKDCSKKHLCKYCCSSRDIQCRYCNQVSCTKMCPDYQEEVCTKLSKPPYVCNGCANIRRCPCVKNMYYAKDAQLDYERTLSESRSGVIISDNELKALDELLSPLLKNGQSIYNITVNNADQINLSTKTLYNYVNLGLLQAKRIDMPRAVRRKPGVKKSVHHKVDPKCRNGRTFEDYNNYMTMFPDSNVCQTDTVEGRKGGKCILRLFFPTPKLQFGILREHNDSRSVSQAFQHLYSIMDHDIFHLLFDVILTDNGSEFSNPSAIEALEDNGKHPHVFYCEPNRSDQKGACENDHSNFRRIVPKGTDMDLYTQNLIDFIFSNVNSFSRASLNGKTPYKSFEFLYGKEVLDLWHIQFIAPNDVVLKPSLISKYHEKEGEHSNDVHQ